MRAFCAGKGVVWSLLLIVCVSAASGIAFSTFLGLHLVNTLSANFGGEATYNTVQQLFRHYYQNKLVEPGMQLRQWHTKLNPKKAIDLNYNVLSVVVVGAALGIHMGSSALRITKRWLNNRKKPVAVKKGKSYNIAKTSQPFQLLAYCCGCSCGCCIGNIVVISLWRLVVI